MILLLSIPACTNETEEEAENAVSTVDSNTIVTTDTVPRILYLDDPRLDTLPIAMDSAGPTIEAADTQYRRSATYTVTE